MTTMLFNLAGSYVTTAQLVISLAGMLLSYGIYKISTFIHDEMTSPSRDIPEPPSLSFLYGNYKELSASAINYVLFNNYDYPKPEDLTYNSRKLFGNGVVTAEGDVHKHQSTEIAKHGDIGPIECLSWMSRTTLDIVGLAGFNYKSNALTSDPEKNDLMKSFSTIFKAGAKPTFIPMLRAICPLCFLSAPSDAETKKASAVMGRIGSDLLKQSESAHEDDNRSNKLSGRRQDILSLLVQANTMQDLPEAQRMEDGDVLAQIPLSLSLVMKHQGTPTAMTWALYALTQNKQAQTKLRQEVFDASTDNSTVDNLNGLPYLYAVVRKNLRLYQPVPVILRAAKKDYCIPLSKPFAERKRIVRNEIRVRNGQLIVVPIVFINRDKSIWREDSTEFKLVSSSNFAHN
ncbi:cytochrome P450 [Phlegmacium glaucopus]|nr:cytochrome P450 [Phlegmacium glaucopus]